MIVSLISALILKRKSKFERCYRIMKRLKGWDYSCPFFHFWELSESSLVSAIPKPAIRIRVPIHSTFTKVFHRLDNNPVFDVFECQVSVHQIPGGHSLMKSSIPKSPISSGTIPPRNWSLKSELAESSNLCVRLCTLMPAWIATKLNQSFRLRFDTTVLASPRSQRSR